MIHHKKQIMKNVYSLGLLICMAITLNAQPTNDWIDFDKTYYKIKVAEDGIYRLDYATLKQSGFPTDFTDAKRFSLINEGNEVPLYINDVNWGEGAYIEFYGKKLDGQFDTRLFENPDDQLHAYWSQFTDTAVYFLNYAEPGNKITEIENDLSNLPEKETYFNYTAVHYTNSSHSSGIPDARIYSALFEEHGGITSYFARFGEGEGWIGSLYSTGLSRDNNSISYSIPAPAVFYDDNLALAHINFKISGISRDTSVINDHKVQVLMNGTRLVEDQFDGYVVKEYDIEVPLNQLTAQTDFEFTAISPEENLDKQAVSYITINYPRGYDFKGVDHLAFTIDNKATGNYLAFENLDAEEVYWIYDLTNHQKVKLQHHAEKEVHQIYLPAGNGEKRALIVQIDKQIKTVASLATTIFTDYSNVNNQGDYILITHPTLNSANGAVNNYVNYRASDNGGNYTPVVVDVENLYDQYSYGIRKHPLAIKYFLNDAIEKWGNSPTHCLLLGKAIKNSRCRTSRSIGDNPLTNWHKNLVPSFGDSPNDQYFGAKNFNPLSRIAIGRLSVDNEQDIQHYLDKVVTVEQDNNTNDCNYIDEAQWRHQMFHIGGGDAIEQAIPYAERLMHQANIAKNGVLTANSSYLYKSNEVAESDVCTTFYDNEGDPVLEGKEECFSRVFEEGKRIVNFLGHASGLLWEIKIGDPEDHTYNQKYPVIISQSNFNGDAYKPFAEEGTFSMPEAWLKAGEAGATAFIGFGFIFEMMYAADLIDDLHNEMFNLKPEATLGEQVNAAIHQYYNNDDIITRHATDKLIFSGDPALKYYINTKPEVVITENDVSVTVNQISDFYYSLEIVFDVNRLNIASVNSIPYNIVLLAGDTETEVSSEFVKMGEQGIFKGEFTLLPNQAHRFRIQLDHQNIWDEICEDNNIVEFNASEWVVIGINDEHLSAHSISNHPNPFSAQTVFEISLNENVLPENNVLTILNLSGKKVHQLVLDKGLAQQSIIWDGRDATGNSLASGVYWYQLNKVNGEMMSLPKKIVLVK